MTLLLTARRRGTAAVGDSISVSASTSSSSVTQGSTTTVTFTLTRNGAFTGTVTPTAAGLPSGVSASFSPTTFGAGVTSMTMTLTATGGAGLVTDDAYTVTFAGSGVSSVVYNGTVSVTSSGASPALTEDFSTYSSTSNFLADPRSIYWLSEDIQTGQMTLDTGVAYSGLTQSIRYDYPSGTGTDYTVSRMLRIPGGTVQELWTEVAVKFSSGFTVYGNGQGVGPALKLLHTEVNGVAGRFGLAIEYDRVSAEGPNDDYSNLYLTSTGAATTLQNASWHILRHYVRLGTTDFHQYWMDGVSLGSASGTTAATNLWGVALARNLNMQPASPQSMYLGYVKLYTSNPGW